MMDQKMVEGILWNDYYKVAWVNIVTGDYDFVKILETEEEKPCLEARTIYEYSELIVSTGLVPDDDVEQYQRCTIALAIFITDSVVNLVHLYHEGSHGEAQQGHGEFPAYHRQRREVGQA